MTEVESDVRHSTRYRGDVRNMTATRKVSKRNCRPERPETGLLPVKRRNSARIRAAHDSEY